MTSLKGPQDVNFKHHTKHITVVLFWIILTKFVTYLFLQFRRNVLRTLSKPPEKTFLEGRPQDINFEPLVQMHIHCIIFNFILSNVCLKE